ncbi:Acyl-CoA synthetase (NDP forming) [Shimia gijangensis]|uniref:Acyl-CoA synthetase (NDP forming) n=1 Tax=Shimia gijangensis TaxID=1470563 RepID=A0A1M6CBQ9_9RHOB|nr:acetate--CoA ligase family protein [Shimia gijangensis]SHI58224.1 Acyl-CoA synthetase (NDP forming) [Shimia gijangensis]
MTPAQRRNFDRLLSPDQIAFVGGSDAITAIKEARRRGFKGKMWAVNPKRETLAGLTCYPTLDDLPGVPDAVFLAIPAKAAVPAIKKLADMGAGGIACYAAGFKEAGGEGVAAEEALKGAVGDMALIGPNCYGVINYLGNSALWPFEHGGSSPGYGAAIITQSGMFSSDITMSQRSLPMAYMISAGNQAVMGLEDYLDVLSDDPAVRAIGLHIEGLRDIPHFERAALKALKNNTPVVALKTGTSTIGSALTISHTGSLSGSNELYEALFDRTGVISVSNPSQMLETLKYLCVVDAPKGTRVAGFTCSGGGATMLADHSEKIGLSFPPIAEQTFDILTELLPDIATVSNPLDYTTPIWGQPEITYPVFLEAMKDSGVEMAVLVQDYPAASIDDSKIYYQNDAGAFARAARELGIPAAICATLPENIDPETREFLISEGVAPMQGIHETLNAMQQAAQWNQVRQRILQSPPEPLQAAADAKNLVMITEDKGKVWMANAGVAVPAGRCVSANETAEVAGEIGYPVALKMMSPDLAHKTEAGAVTLGIEGEAALEKAVQDMRASVTAFAPKAVTDWFLVEQMSAPPLAELIVGLRRDPQFGSALTLGSGGILVELIADAQTLLLPCSVQDIKIAITGLKAGHLLNGFRGRQSADLDRIAASLHNLCQEFLKHSDSLAEIEVNPMFVYPGGIVAVDALIHEVTR